MIGDPHSGRWGCSGSRSGSARWMTHHVHHRGTTGHRGSWRSGIPCRPRARRSWRSSIRRCSCMRTQRCGRRVSRGVGSLCGRRRHRAPPSPRRGSRWRRGRHCDGTPGIRGVVQHDRRDWCSRSCPFRPALVHVHLAGPLGATPERMPWGIGMGADPLRFSGPTARGRAHAPCLVLETRVGQSSGQSPSTLWQLFGVLFAMLAFSVMWTSPS